VVREADDLTTFMCRMSWKSGSLNLLEPSGPHQACNGMTLPLPFTCALYSIGTATDCAPEFYVTVWHFSWKIYQLDVPECPHLVGVSRKYEFYMPMCNYFLQPVYVLHCYLSKPHTLCCYSGVYFLLTSFFYHFFGSFFIFL